MRGFIPSYEMRMPSSLDEALRMLAGEPGIWKPFAGGTDLMVLFEAGKLVQKRFINLWGLPELRGIEATKDAVTIGAMTTYTQIQQYAVLRDEFPLLCEAASLTGAVAIQNRGTIGGNIANASPAADSLPALLVYEAELDLISSGGSRRIAYRDFHTGYKATVLRDDELIKAIRLPRSTTGWQQYARKVGTRKAQAISKICIAAMAQTSGGAIRDVRIAFGSVAPTPIRVWKTEAALKGRPIDAITIKAGRTELQSELSPIDDVRSTAEYRSQVAANLLEEFLRRSK